MADRKLLGERLNFEEKISLAQLVNQPGWSVLVSLMAESCRRATEEVIKLDPTTPRYQEVLAGLQTTARAMNKFSTEVLDSVKLHQRIAVQEAQKKEKPNAESEAPNTRFKGFKFPQTGQTESPTEGAKQN